MKKLIGSLLMCVMLFTVPVFATGTAQSAVTNPDGTKTVTVSLDTIESILTDYSPAMRKIVKDRDAAESTYRKLEDTMDDLQEAIADAPSTTEGWTLATQASKQYESLENSYKQAKLARDTAKEQYRLNVSQQVNTVKQQYLGYSLDQSKLSNLNAQLTAQRQTLTSAASLLERGYLSKKVYDSMVQTTESMADSLRAQQTVVDGGERSLRLSLGVPESVKLVYAEANLSQFEFSQISGLDLDKDTQSMLQGSVQLKNAKLTYESYRANDDVSEAQAESAKIAWEQAVKSETERMKTLYQNLQDGYHTLLTTRTSVETQRATLAAAETKYLHGYISTKTLTDLRNQTAVQETSLKAQEIALYSKLLSYQQMKAV